jgi:hypothetical protein
MTNTLTYENYVMPYHIKVYNYHCFHNMAK